MKNKIKRLVFFCCLSISFTGCTQHIKQKAANKTQKDISLKEHFGNNCFLIGTAINEDQILEKDVHANTIIKNEFNTISPENVMKWMYIQPKPNVYNFDFSDKYVSYGNQNNMHVVGHTLVWHSQMAKFMKQITDSTIMANHVEDYINTVVSRYKGKIGTWDVVNEALNEDGTLRTSIYYKILGKNYIENAFKLAEKADPNAELAYNDYNLCKPKKRAGAIKLIKELKSNGAKINSIGIQAHWQLNSPSLKDIEETIVAFSELGVKVMFTELDISVLPNPFRLVGAEVNQNFKQLEGNSNMNPYPEKLPDSVQDKLAKRYKDIFKLFIKHKDKISRITFWGVTDKDSWLNNWPIKGRTNYPLLFDRNYQPKKAYYSIIDLENK